MQIMIMRLAKEHVMEKLVICDNGDRIDNDTDRRACQDYTQVKLRWRHSHPQEDVDAEIPSGGDYL